MYKVIEDNVRVVAEFATYNQAKNYIEEKTGCLVQHVDSLEIVKEFELEV